MRHRPARWFFSSDTLRDTRKLQALHKTLAAVGFVDPDETGLALMIAAAAFANRVGKNPGALFASIVEGRKWSAIGQQDHKYAQKAVATLWSPTDTQLAWLESLVADRPGLPVSTVQRLAQQYGVIPEAAHVELALFKLANSGRIVPHGEGVRVS